MRLRQLQLRLQVLQLPGAGGDIAGLAIGVCGPGLGLPAQGRHGITRGQAVSEVVQAGGQALHIGAIVGGQPRQRQFGPQAARIVGAIAEPGQLRAAFQPGPCVLRLALVEQQFADLAVQFTQRRMTRPQAGSAQPVGCPSSRSSARGAVLVCCARGRRLRVALGCMVFPGAGRQKK